MKRFYVITMRSLEFFRVERGRLIWEELAGSCEDCGCDINTGRRTGEEDSELAARLRGKRTTPKGGTLACANCGREYAVKVDTE